MRPEDHLRQLLGHPDPAVVCQGVELARTMPIRRRMALVGRLMMADEPWVCLALVTTDPDPHTRRFAAWCARPAVALWEVFHPDEAAPRRVHAFCTAHPGEPVAGADRAELAALAGKLERLDGARAALLVVRSLLEPDARKAGHEVMVGAREVARFAAREAATRRAWEARNALWERSKDTELARNVYDVSLNDSRMAIRNARDDARLEQQTELYRRCEALARPIRG